MYLNSAKTGTGQKTNAVKRQKLDAEAIRDTAKIRWNGNTSKPITRSATTTKPTGVSKNSINSKLPGPTMTITRKRTTDSTVNKNHTINSKYVAKKDFNTQNIPPKSATNKRGTPNPVVIKSNLPAAINRSMIAAKKPQWNRNNTSSSLGRKVQRKDSKTIQNIITDSGDIAIQTQEEEILNHSLIVGDIKFLNPSRHIVDEIEKGRRDLKNKQLLKTKRKFPEHSERQEEHLTDLQEFLDKSYVSKRKTPRKSCDAFAENQK